MTPEQAARVGIDKKLEDVGYIIQNMSEFNPAAGLGVVVREFPTKSGPVDYLIFINRVPVGVIEAKEQKKGEKILDVAKQSKRYAESGLLYMSNIPSIRFAYEATDVLTVFCDYKDLKYRSRRLFSFHQPETLEKWLKDDDTLRNRLKFFPAFDDTGFRKCQTKAIINLEKSFGENRPRALVQMATGAGKTFSAITTVYRLLKHAKAKRILFLVDTKNLGEQAEEEFRKYKPTDDARLFPELYNVRRLNSHYVTKDTRVCISTIQRMFSILNDEEFDETSDEVSLNEQKIVGQPREVAYNKDFPIEFFDFIVIDECHRSIYNIWQQVLDYFDASLVGLTATPDERTFGFFNSNVVSEYTHEEAVIDGVNVGRQGTYSIETSISQHGAVILKQVVEKRERLTRIKRWSQLDENLDYRPTQLDKEVVNKTQIRCIIKEFRSKLYTEIFPNRKEVPKTLVFAKTDSHADDIIDIIRDEFGEGNEFCAKITHTVTNSKSVLTSFRNDYYPRIAVTVDMIATGTDVKAIECLLFMRDVRSKNYFEQMIGRATRTLDYDDLNKVTPSATEKKLGYVLIDAVGVTKSKKTTSRQLERKPQIATKNLMMSVVMGARDEDTLTSLANRLLRMNILFSTEENKEAKELANGKSINRIAESLLNSFDDDVIYEKAKVKYNLKEEEEISESQYAEIQNELISLAVEPIYNPKLREFLHNAKKNHDQIIDNENIDSVISSGWDKDNIEKADNIIKTFKKFINDNRDIIDALSIIYSQSYKERSLTLKMVKELHSQLQNPPCLLTTEVLWKSYEIKYSDFVKSKSVENKLADLVSLVRFELGQTKEINNYSTVVATKFQEWVFKKNASGGRNQFTEEQMEWLRLIKDRISDSFTIEVEDFEYVPFDGKGGLGKFYQLFGESYKQLLIELNYALVA